MQRGRHTLTIAYQGSKVSRKASKQVRIRVVRR